MWLLAIPWTVASQAPPSMEFSRQEYWSGFPFPSPGGSCWPRIRTRSPTLRADTLPSEPPGKVKEKVILWKMNIYFSNAQKCAFPQHFDFSALKPSNIISSNEARLWLKITGRRRSDNTSSFADQDRSSGFQNRRAEWLEQRYTPWPCGLQILLTVIPDAERPGFSSRFCH